MWSKSPLTKTPFRRRLPRTLPSRKLTVERLEDRAVPSATVLDDFAGLNFHIDAPFIPPDPHVAAGPRQLVEVVNNDIAFFNKNTGNPIFTDSLVNFFAPVLPAGTPFFQVFDPRTSYDELAGRFIVTALDEDANAETSHLLLAVSDDADPRGSWEMHRINVEDSDTHLGDYDQLGWDADAIYVSLFMIPWAGGDYGTSVLTIDKASVLDNDSSTLAYTDVNRSAAHYVMAPAIMHGASPGDPMYFVDASPVGRSGATIRVVRMTDKLSANPTFTDFHIPVPHYDATPLAAQPSGEPLDTVKLGAAITNVVWRDGRLVASQHAGSNGLAQARWYEFNTNGATPTLAQSGQINPGPGVHTYYPAIEIAANGDLGMTFMQSSATEFPSVYVTGRKLTDPAGMMQTPVLVRAGEESFRHPDFADPAPYRAGDYSGIAVDPQDGTFWAAGEYAKVFPDILPLVGWGTWIANFSIRDAADVAAASAVSTADELVSPAGALVQVSGPSPFLDCPIAVNDPGFGQSTEVEPYLAVDPTDPNHLVGAWIQDFARGIVAAVSFDGGSTWQSVTIPGVTQCAGGTYPHAADPWVSFAPNGDVYVSLIAFSGFPPRGDPNALVVSKSTDGGLTWGDPITIVTGDNDFQEKEAITADPTNSQYAYVTWSRFENSRGTGMVSRTTDGGQTWEPARAILDPGGNNTSVCPQIVVLPDGTLVNVFTLQSQKSSAGGIRHYDFELALLRSSDHGQTWLTTPIPVADILPLSDTATVPGARGVANPDGGLGVIAPYWFFDVAVDPANGNLYAVWQDARFSDFQHASIAFSMSTDGGFTWSAPIQVNQTPDNIAVGNRQAFLPSVAVNQDGVVAVTYYDFRDNTPAAGVPTDYWMVRAHPSADLTNPASWASEDRLTTTSFNIENATTNPGAYFIGDYQGLVARGSDFGALFAMPTETDLGSVFYRDSSPAELSVADHGDSAVIADDDLQTNVIPMDQFHAQRPAAVIQPLLAEGFLRWTDAGPPLWQARGLGPATFLFVRRSELEAAAADDVLTTSALTSLDSLLVGTADFHEEQNRSFDVLSVEVDLKLMRAEIIFR